MPEQSQQITVVRHGETSWSATGQHTGRTDIELTERGRESATRAGGMLRSERFDRVWTSPLRRAHDTCTLAGFGDDASVHDELMEWDYGEYEGRTRQQIVVDAPGWQVWTDGVPGGESVEQVQQRVNGVVEELLDLPGHTLIFAHGHLLRALAAAWIELPITEGRRLLLDTAALGTLGWYHGRRALARWNVLPA
jgi:broad specificity phosphatase PhoE